MGLVNPAPGDERAFFEIAATLIPILLFGGVLVERAKPYVALVLVASMSMVVSAISLPWLAGLKKGTDVTYYKLVTTLSVVTVVTTAAASFAILVQGTGVAARNQKTRHMPRLSKRS